MNQVDGKTLTNLSAFPWENTNLFAPAQKHECRAASAESDSLQKFGNPFAALDSLIAGASRSQQSYRVASFCRPCYRSGESMTEIEEIQLIGNEVAVRWKDGTENFFRMDKLRALSPSAETQGERDLLGNEMMEVDHGQDFDGVTVTNWNAVGGYAIQFHFSDGHNTGIYAYDYLKAVAPKAT